MRLVNWTILKKIKEIIKAYLNSCSFKQKIKAQILLTFENSDSARQLNSTQASLKS